MNLRKLFPILMGGAVAAADSAARELNAGKHSKQHSKKKQNLTKEGKARKRKRQMQKKSRRRNRK